MCGAPPEIGAAYLAHEECRQEQRIVALASRA
jgi:hypothetical protein